MIHILWTTRDTIRRTALHAFAPGMFTCVGMMLAIAGCASAPRASNSRPDSTASAIHDASPVASIQASWTHIEELPPDSLLSDYSGSSYPRISSHWVDSILATLPLRRRIAQMIVPFTFSDPDGRSLRELRMRIEQEGVGGVIVSTGSVSQAERLIDSMQRWASVPLLISADFENGIGFRLRGGTEFPSFMALGAAGEADLAFDMGLAVAAEARAIGVQENYAPIADVNNNPVNPVINVRSAGEEPSRVASIASAYARGLQQGRMIATAKHFPGHGDTDIDSHSDLPVMSQDRLRLDSIELVPFRRLIDDGILAVMSGHLAVPAIDRDSTRPATLSSAISDSLLRHAMGFHGLLVTDALNMKGLTRHFRNATASVEAVRAGADILLMPLHVGEAVDAIASAVEHGEIPAERIEHSVRRILSYKQWVGLSTGSRLERTTRDSVIGCEQHRALARTIARRAVTLVRNDSALLPLSISATGHVVSVLFLQSRDTGGADAFADSLRMRFPDATVFLAESGITPKERRLIIDSLKQAEMVILASFITVRTGSNGITLTPEQQLLADAISQSRTPCLLLSFGSPYIISAMPWVPAFVCAYGFDSPSVQTALDVVSGSTNPSGHLPVSIPGIARRGFGLSFPRARDTGPDTTVTHAFRPVDSLIESRIRSRAFPGAQLAVIRDGKLLVEHEYGTLTYDPASAAVTPETMYDLASLTKVVATTTAAMLLYQEGKLDLDSPVVRYLPAFASNGKGRITIRNLLLHNSGLIPFRTYFMYCRTAKEAIDTILAERLVYPTGTKTVYSDLNMIVLGKVIEALAGMPLDTFVNKRIFKPLGMQHTRFTPPDSLRSTCAPTEVDTIWRKRVVQGTVHDETAALLGGVAGHAGLFSTARDLTIFAEMLMNGGRIDSTQILEPEIISLFTRRQHAGSRALGWDTRSTFGSSAGSYFSSRSFGHTGFTGTSIWIDPDSKIAVVFLTNRTYPTRENKQLLPFRAILHDAVRKALLQSEGRPAE